MYRREFLRLAALAPASLPSCALRGQDTQAGPSQRARAAKRVIVIGAGLWLFTAKTRVGAIIRAGVDDAEMVSALGINTQVIFVLLFGLGAALAGLAGGVEGTLTSVSITDDGTYLLWSLIVVIIGGLGSISGAAIGAVIIGLVEQYGLAYSPTNAETIIFVIMVIVLALRPQGLLGRPG